MCDHGQDGQPPQGGGEPAIIAVGAAVGNAIFNATGQALQGAVYTGEGLEAIRSLKVSGLKVLSLKSEV
jgi:hypothetical protein